MNYFNVEYITSAISQMESISGIWGMLVLTFIQALQIVVAFLPGGIVEVVGGMIYGTANGIVISVTGIFLGSMFAFYIARRFGRGIVKKFVKEEQFLKYETLLKRKRFKELILLLFFLPGVPKDALIYVIGVASTKKMGIAASLIRVPSIIVSVYAGGLFKSGNIKFALTVYIMFLATGLIGLFAHDRIMKYYDKHKQ